MQKALWCGFKLGGLLLVLSGCSTTGVFLKSAYVRWAPWRNFQSHTHALNVYYAVGAETASTVVTNHVDAMQERLAKVFGAPIQERPSIYLCATTACMDTFPVRPHALAETGEDGNWIVLHGTQLLKDRRLKPVLMHELVLAYWLQHAGNESPRWWREGLAAGLTGGAGSDVVTDAEALNAMRQGHVFQFDRRSLSWPWTPDPDAQLERTVYVKQAALFVDYLRSRQPLAYDHVLELLQRGEDLFSALEKAYFVQPLTLFEQWRAGVVSR